MRYTLAKIRKKQARGEPLPPKVTTVLERARQVLTEAWRQLDTNFRAAIDQEFGPGTADALGDPWDMPFLCGPLEVRDADLNILAARLRWSVAVEDQDVLQEQARTHGRRTGEERRSLSQRGLLLAAEAINTPQRIRLGTRWVVASDGRQAILCPSDLHPVEAVQWFATASKEAAKAMLRDEPWPHASGDALTRTTATMDEALLLSVACRDPLFELLEGEVVELVQALMEAAGLKPAEKRLVAEVMKRDGDWCEAGRARGLAHKSLPVYKSTIRRKLRAALRTAPGSGLLDK